MGLKGSDLTVEIGVAMKGSRPFDFPKELINKHVSLLLVVYLSKVSFDWFPVLVLFSLAQARHIHVILYYFRFMDIFKF